MYCTEFGYYLLDAIDTNTNNFGLLFIVWAECVSTTILYRYRDVVGQVGWPAFLVHNGGYISAKVIGLIIAHTASPGGGAGAGFGIYIIAVVTSLIIAKTPDSIPPRFWGANVWMNKLWWLGFYSVRLYTFFSTKCIRQPNHSFRATNSAATSTSPSPRPAAATGRSPGTGPSAYATSPPQFSRSCSPLVILHSSPSGMTPYTSSPSSART